MTPPGPRCAQFLPLGNAPQVFDETVPALLGHMWCAGFRHSEGLHARVILDGATSRLSELGDVRDVLSVPGVW